MVGCSLAFIDRAERINASAASYAVCACVCVYVQADLAWKCETTHVCTISHMRRRENSKHRASSGAFLSASLAKK